MTVYCDRLTLRSSLRIAGLYLRRSGRGAWVLRVLDAPTGSGTEGRLAGLLRNLGIVVEQTEFFAGHMRAGPGERRVPSAAAALANDVAFSAAEDLLARSPLLAAVNGRWRRDTVRLYIAKGLWFSLYEVISRVLVASELDVGGDDSAMPIVILHTPPGIDPRWVNAAFHGVAVHWCAGGKSPSAGFKRSLRALSTIAGMAWSRRRRNSGARASGAAGEPVAATAPPVTPTLPGVLVLQQDDLGMDRSYRTQPHWLLPSEKPTSFRICVLPKAYVGRTSYDASEMAAHGVIVVDSPLRLVLRRLWSGAAAPGSLRGDVLRCAIATMFSVGPARAALRSTRGLLLRAWGLAKICDALNIRAFVSAEGFLIETDAMQIVAPHVGVKTLSYQYSNLSGNSVVMMNTADVMLTFSAAYEPLLVRDGIGPRTFVPSGYVFDSAFALFRERAHARRRGLQDAGAEFVICFLDETVNDDRYGLIHADEHMEELKTLFRVVLDDPTAGLVVKTQYVRHSPSQRYSSLPELQAVLRTGRYIEVLQGTHRNTAFPAEAALCADIAIGHAVGATAALEAALTGRRSIMLNPYGITGQHHGVYSRANILFASLAEALEAVRRYRSGDPCQADLGDWTAIAPHFDNFRDGRAAIRMREAVERLVDRADTGGRDQVTSTSNRRH